jgi:hypothetical protein
MERVLVVIIAETRAHEFTYQLFKKNVLDALQADLALCVAKNEWEDTNNPFYQQAKFVWTYDEPKDWGSALDAAQIIDHCQGDWRRLLKLDGILMGGVHDEQGRTKGSGSILLFFRWLLKHQLMSSGVLDMYDRFIVTRSDYIYLTPHYPIHRMDPGMIWIPDGEDYDGEDYRGYTDRHIVASRQDVLNVLSVADPILCSPEALYEEMHRKKQWNLERYIRFAFNRLGLEHRVRRFPYTMYTVRSGDGRTSWSSGTFSKELGYHIKYRDEYRKSLIASKLIRKPEDWNAQTTTAFFQTAAATQTIQDYTTKWVHPIGNPLVKEWLCKLLYGTVLSDKWFRSVYSRLAVAQAQLLKITGSKGALIS